MAREVFDTFGDQVNAQKQEMIDILEAIDIDSLKNEGLEIVIGGKRVKFKDLEIIEEDSLEERIRREFKDKLNIQQQRIREKINAKINQLLVMNQSKQQELERKERELEIKYRGTAKMPDINMVHLSKGLSVIKGNANDEIIWTFRGVYNPKFIDHKPIPARLVSRMKRDIIFIIKTRKDKITEISTRDLCRNDFELPYFDHYHQNNPDCWGQWRKPSSWRNANDIIKAVKDGEAVLENINTGSVARRSPSGLPRLQTLKNNTENVAATEGPAVRNDDSDDNDVWDISNES